MEESRRIPVYKPTPIKMLEQRSLELSMSQKNNSHEFYPFTPEEPSNYNVGVPIYRPTPIDELEKYSPSIVNPDISTDFSRNKNSWSVPVAKPTYSPVVRSVSSIPGVDAPELGTGFVCLPNSLYYQPSPTESLLPISKAHGYPSVSETNKKVSTVKSVGESVSSITRLKRPKVADENEDDVTEDKRRKILTLYHDLYGPEESKCEDLTTIEPLLKNKQNTNQLRTSSSSSSLLSRENSSTAVDVKAVSTSLDAKKGSAVTIQTRPRVPLRQSNRIPMPIRTRYLDQFIEACLLICSSKSDAYKLALNEEQACHDKSASRMAYLNAVIQTLKDFKTRKPVVSAKGVTAKSYQLPKVREEIDEGSREKELDLEVKGQTFYSELERFLLSEEELVANSYPRPDKRPGVPRGHAVIAVPPSKQTAMEACAPNERFCCRCSIKYIVNSFGEALSKERCVYHWGKLIRRRVHGHDMDLRYTCCQAESGQPGCQINQAGHVHEHNKWHDLDGYVRTLPALPTPAGQKAPVKVHALDCEMIYTTAGFELARVTVIDVNLNVIIDHIIRPDNPVIDPNSRFSGLRLSDLDKATRRITDVQIELLHLWDEETILIGHSLESDLAALRIIHDKIVDTSLVFPHRMGLPFKRSLQNITADFLQQIIQQSSSGHDSREDAIACMRLMQQRVKEELRKKRRPLK